MRSGTEFATIEPGDEAPGATPARRPFGAVVPLCAIEPADCHLGNRSAGADEVRVFAGG